MARSPRLFIAPSCVICGMRRQITGACQFCFGRTASTPNARATRRITRQTTASRRRAQWLVMAGQRPSQPDPFPTFASAESGRRKCPPASRLDRPRIIAAEFVRPFRLSGKNDADDAEVVCTAVREAKLRFVSIKSVDQQAVLGLHRIRRGFIEERTAAINRLRGFWRSSES